MLSTVKEPSDTETVPALMILPFPESVCGQFHTKDIHLLQQIHTLQSHSESSHGEQLLLRYSRGTAIRKGVARVIGRMLQARQKRLWNDIYRFCEHFVEMTQQPDSICIVSLVYLVRMLECTHERITIQNWKQMLFCAFMLALKYLEEEQIMNEFIVEVWKKMMTIPMDVTDFVNLEFYLVSHQEFRLHIPLSMYSQLEKLVVTTS